MNLWESFITLTDRIEKIYLKIMEENEQKDIYFELLEDLFQKEEKFLHDLTIQDFESLKGIFQNRYHLSFENDFLFEVLTHEKVPNCILRAYHLIYDRELFYQLQKYTRFSFLETTSILGNPYIENLQKKYHLFTDLRRIEMQNYKVLNLKEKHTIFYLEMRNVSDFFQEDSLSNIDFSFYGISFKKAKNYMYQNVMTLTKKLLLETDREQMIRLATLLKAYIETVDVEERQVLQKYVQLTWNQNKKDEKISETNLCMIQKVLESSSLSDIKMTHKSGVFTPPSRLFYLPLFDLEEFQYFHGVYQRLIENSFDIWTFYRVLMESKKNQEPVENRTFFKKELNRLLEKENSILEQVRDLEKFQNYVLCIYSKSLQIFPFYALDVAKATLQYSTISDVETVKGLLEERLIKTILDKKPKEKNIDWISNLALLENDKNQNPEVKRLEILFKEMIKWQQGRIEEEEFFDMIENLQFGKELIPEDTFLTTMNLIFEIYMKNLQKYLKENPDSKYYDLFFLCEYCVHFFEQNLQSFLVMDLEISYDRNFSFPTISEKDYEDVKGSIYGFIEQYFSSTNSYQEPDQLSFQFYCDALKLFFPKEDMDEILFPSTLFLQRKK